MYNVHGNYGSTSFILQHALFLHSGYSVYSSLSVTVLIGLSLKVNIHVQHVHMYMYIYICTSMVYTCTYRIYIVHMVYGIYVDSTLAVHHCNNNQTIPTCTPPLQALFSVHTSLIILLFSVAVA